MRPIEDQKRRLRGQRQIAEHRQPERERDRHAGENRGGDHADEKDQKIEIAETMENRRAEPEQRHEHGDCAERDEKRPRRPHLGEPKQREYRHQHNSDRKRSGAPDIGNLQRRRRNRYLFAGILVGRLDDEEQKSQCRAGGERIERGPGRRRQHADASRHAHVLVAAECNHGPEHGEPQKQRSTPIRPTTPAAG